MMYFLLFWEPGSVLRMIGDEGRLLFMLDCLRQRYPPALPTVPSTPWHKGQMALRWSWEGLWKGSTCCQAWLSTGDHLEGTEGQHLGVFPWVPLKEWSQKMMSPLPAEAAVRFSGGCQLTLWSAWCQDTHRSCPETCPWAHLFFLCQVHTGNQVDPLDNFLALNAITEKKSETLACSSCMKCLFTGSYSELCHLSSLNRHKPRT